MMQMDQRLRQRPEMKHLLAPQMQQSLQMLQMNSMELDQFIEQNVEMNPFLDRAAPRETVLSEIASTASNTPGDSEETLEAAYEQAVLGRQERELPRGGERDDWDLFDRRPEGTDFSRNSDMEEVWKYYQDSVTQDESLRSHLLDQLRITCSDPLHLKIGERIIIGDMDKNGYFTGDVGEIALELGVPAGAVAEVLEIIKKFEPTGIGAADIIECLLLQIEVEYPEEPLLKVLLNNHWQALTQGRIPQIAEGMGISIEKVMELKGMLARLDPFPGREYENEPPPYVIPDATVEIVDNDHIVTLTSDNMPAIMINEAYIKEIRSRKMSPDEHLYVNERLDSARMLVRNLERRKDTIRKTAQAIVDMQHEFMVKGVAHMKPLTLEEIADKVGVHESTISRTVNGKYIQTPQGLFEMKYFFSSGLRRSDGGEDQSSTAVCAQIRKIIDEENKRQPLSDQKISDLLNQQGIHVARRTVTKYREQMHIFPVKMRRTY